MLQEIEPSIAFKKESQSYCDNVNEFSVEYKVNLPDDPPSDLIHFHSCFEIVFYIQSNNTMYLDDTTYAICSHNIMLIPPRRIHKLSYQAGMTYSRYVLYFPASYIKKLFDEANAEKALQIFNEPLCNKIDLSLSEFSRLNSLFKNMAHHQRHHADTHYSVLDAYCAVILKELFFILQKQTPSTVPCGKNLIMEQILRYLNTHYMENILLDDLEKALFLNKYYLCRVFAENMGSSMVEYLRFKRIVEAQKLLNDTDKEIIDICFECGFNNLQHFYRTFKKITTLTPKQFRDGYKVQFTQTLSSSLTHGDEIPSE